MTAAFGVALHHEILSGGLECNFQGVALGDSWISPIDSVLTWAPYLYQVSLLDEKDFQEVDKVLTVNNWHQPLRLFFKTSSAFCFFSLD